LPDTPLDGEQINDEKDVDQYAQDKMNGEKDAELANIHGEGKATVRLVEAKRGPSLVEADQ